MLDTTPPPAWHNHRPAPPAKQYRHRMVDLIRRHMHSIPTNHHIVSQLHSAALLPTPNPRRSSAHSPPLPTHPPSLPITPPPPIAPKPQTPHPSRQYSPRETKKRVLQVGVEIFVGLEGPPTTEASSDIELKQRQEIKRAIMDAVKGNEDTQTTRETEIGDLGSAG